MRTHSKELQRLLEDIDRKCRANRSPYVPIAYFKHFPDYKEKLKELKRRGLIFYYKTGEAVGISKKGDEILRIKRRRKGESFSERIQTRT